MRVQTPNTSRSAPSVVGTLEVLSQSHAACQQSCAGDRKFFHCPSPVSRLIIVLSAILQTPSQAT
jgi:hypothetical protein